MVMFMYRVMLVQRSVIRSVATEVLTSISSNSNGAAGGECRNLLQPETGHFINWISYNLKFWQCCKYNTFDILIWYIHKWILKIRYCRSLTKVKFSTDQVRPALGSDSWLIGWWIVNHAQKPENGPISDLFNLTQNTFCLYCLIPT